MEELNPEIMKMIEELEYLEHRKKTDGIEDAETDRYGYSFEPMDAFSPEPLGFVERSMRLQTEALTLFRLACRTSRFSPLFPRISGQLERMVGQLGICCITKAVLEQREGETFSLLDALTIETLRQIVAFNFRKSYSAFMESDAAGYYKPEVFDLSVRWAALDRRLEATADKIEKIKTGKVKIDLSEKTLPAGSNENAPENGGKRTGSASFSEKGSAFPVDKAAVRESDRQKSAAAPISKSPDAVPEPAGSIFKGILNSENDEEDFKRSVLLDDAADRSDREAREAVLLAQNTELEALWEKYMERESCCGFAHLQKLGFVINTGPPPEEELEPALLNIEN